jgi:hypothetical protein
MENRFFVEAKSFIFSVVEGSFELRVAEKRKGFSGWIRLGMECVAWLLSMVKRCCRIRASRILLNLSERAQRCPSFGEVGIAPAGSWKWRCTLWVAEDG